MVKPVVSGVVFSRNPVNGANEVVVEAVEGSGEALLQAGCTPQRWIYVRGVFTSQPDEAALPLKRVEDVVKGARVIARRHKTPVDLEWVFDGEGIYWVQLREITSLGQVKVYSNTISRDMLPGMINPLVWSVNVPMVSRSWVRLLTEFTGPNQIDPDSLVKAFYYRTYFEMSTFGQLFTMLGLPADSLELMMTLRQAKKKMAMFQPNLRMVRLLPRLVASIIDKLRFASRIETFLPQMQSCYEELYLTDACHLEDAELLARVRRLIELTGETAYYNIITQLLMQIYHAILRRNVTRAGVDFTNLDLLEGLEIIYEYEPGGYLRQLHDLYRQLPLTAQAMVAAGDYANLQQAPGLENFRANFQSFIERFGHLSDSGNDFSVPPWRELPGMLLKMVANSQPQPLPQKTDMSFARVRFPWWKRPMLHTIYERARRFHLYREQVGSLYTFGYGLLRVYFLALGDHLANRKALADSKDIFYLTFPEVQTLVSGGTSNQDYAAMITQRRTEMERCRDFVPPETIYGDQVPPVNISVSQRLSGTPTSRGCYTGRVVVVRSLGDFPKLHSGAVLVIPYSDVGWAPLFIHAGGVISETGGMLSHSSIIAREYGIPAVVSVPFATHLPDGVMVTVDGFRGEVIVHSEGST
jgi:phosphohistidine swiveling domain-containing protein